MMKVFNWISTGYCTALEAIAQRGGGFHEIEFPAHFGLLQHEQLGPVLFDTGYSMRFFEATQVYPYKLYQKATPVFTSPEQSAVAQLKRMGIEPESVQHILLSHFHGDHVCGLKDFPNARFYCHREALEELKAKDGFRAVSAGLLPDLFPSDFESRCVLLDESNALYDPYFGHKWDVFGDQSVEMVYLPGHGRGQIGARFTVDDRQVFLVADAAWLGVAITEGKLPLPVVRLFFDNWAAYKKTLNALRAYHKNYPKTLLIPTHCSKKYWP